jgi:hypothetical protein
MFCWTGSIRYEATAVLATLQSEGRLHEYGFDLHNYSDYRVGRFDSMAFIYRITGSDTHFPSLALINPQTRGFQSTSSAILLLVKDLVIILVSDANILAETCGFPSYVDAGAALPPSGTVWKTLLERVTRLPDALAFYQPMRWQVTPETYPHYQRVLHPGGQGRIFTAAADEISKMTERIDLSRIQSFPAHKGLVLGALEVIEWLILAKERQANAIRVHQLDVDDLYMKSMPDLLGERNVLIDLLSRMA